MRRLGVLTGQGIAFVVERQTRDSAWSDQREQFEAVKRWYKHNWLRLLGSRRVVTQLLSVRGHNRHTDEFVVESLV